MPVIDRDSRHRISQLLLGVWLVVVGLVVSSGTASAAVPLGSHAEVAEGIAAASRASLVTLNVNHGVLRKGERLWIAGKVTVGGKPGDGRVVDIQRRKGTGAWTTFATVKTRSTGKYRLELRPTKSYKYRARVRAVTGVAAAVSNIRIAKFTANPRNIKDRAQILGSRLGKASSSVSKLTAAQRAATRSKGVRTVQHQRFAKGTLVKVVSSKKTRTWFVTGAIQDVYVRAGGAAGSYGVPTQDAKCGLRGGGCVQRFSRGTIYSNNTRAAGTAVTGRKGEVAAAARSQIGYSYKYGDPKAQNTKFNKFMGNTKAWCSFFLSWASEASGNGALIPKSPAFSKFKTDVQAQMSTGHTPRVGALVFFNTYPPAGVMTHAGLVVAVDKGTITVVDGNTVGNLPAGHRGVLERQWPRSRALLYAYPAY